MKILVVQLARLGDIYQCWPIVRAIRRQIPGAEIHLLVRKRFASALDGIGVDCRIHQMNSAEILEPIFGLNNDHQQALERISLWTNSLRDFHFDRIINLSFSPFSSYLVSAISQTNTEVRGYTRTADGYLAIPDDPSAYFYAQVGVGKSNRAHLCEIFASVAEVELIEQDWSLKVDQQSLEEKNRVFNCYGIPTEVDYVVLHISASDPRKTLSWSQWAKVASGLLDNWFGHLILVGGAEDYLVSNRVIDKCGSSRIHSLVGRASLIELFPCLYYSSLVIGGDSVVIQMSALADVACFSLSFPIANFWETGPLKPGSRVMIVNRPQLDDVGILVEEVLRHLRGHDTKSEMATATEESPVHYRTENYVPSNEFEWEFIRALYMKENFPPVPNELVLHGLYRLSELADLAISQTLTLSKEGVRVAAAEILNQTDILIASIRRMVPELDPLISWFETEKLRIGPGNIEFLALRTRQVFESLKLVASLYTAGEGTTYHGREGAHAEDNLDS
jgi:heptosyltransferase-3